MTKGPAKSTLARQLRVLVCAALFACAQVAMLVHEADIEAHAGQAECTLCHAYERADDALPTASAGPLPAASPMPSDDAQPITLASVDSASFYAIRAPPILI